jgi:type IV pilus assembly protein PilV
MERTTRPDSQRGALLLETLIAILLFSIGILSLVGLQATATRNSTEARYRAEAAYLANQIIGQMWADNRANLASYAHNPATTAPCSFAGAPSGNLNVTAWIGDEATRGTVAHTLPGAASGARQQITVGADNSVSVTLCWLAPGETVPRSFVAVAQING